MARCFCAPARNLANSSSKHRRLAIAHKRASRSLRLIAAAADCRRCGAANSYLARNDPSRIVMEAELMRTGRAPLRSFGFMDECS